VTTRDTGAITSRDSSFSVHAVRMDSESLPTGMARSSCWHHWLTASTVSYRAASCPSTPQAAIQLADSLIFLSDWTSEATKLVSASTTAIRPEAGASSTASGLFSPMAMASPRTDSKSDNVTAQSATGTCQGPTI